jgi:enoyl-[acyl-carrier protein] reductase I
MLLQGKRLLITGVMTHRSIAYSVAEQAQIAGAEVVLTSFGRIRRMTARAAKTLPQTADVLELDVNRDEDYEAVVADLRQRWGAVDGVLHAVANGPREAFGGNFVNTPADAAMATIRTSAYSMVALARWLRPLLIESGGGSLVGFDFDAARAWPTYDWMGVAKATLESITKYLAAYLGPYGTRVNLVAPGPLATPSASSIPGFAHLAGRAEQAPLGWDRTDPLCTARSACFLLSDWASGISGQILHVDGGFRCMGTPFDGMHEVAEALNEAIGATA